MKIETQMVEQIRVLIEEHGLQDVFAGLLLVCQDKTKPAPASDYDKEIAARRGKALVLLSQEPASLTNLQRFAPRKPSWLTAELFAFG